MKNLKSQYMIIFTKFFSNLKFENTIYIMYLMIFYKIKLFFYHFWIYNIYNNIQKVKFLTFRTKTFFI